MMDKRGAEFTFDGIGTSWCILTDDGSLREETVECVLCYMRVFNARFSRFLNDSEASAFRNAEAGEYPISEEFATLLSRADELRRLTGGLYDPAVGGLLEQAGYDAAYSMVPRPDVVQFVLPKWEITGQMLTIDGPVVFDLGGMGKGFCIDRVAEILENHNHRHYLVDGGGDMYATTKRDGGPWRVAIEYPGKPDVAVGTVELENRGIAVSDSFRCRWKEWHHIVHPLLRVPIETVIGVTATARNAWDADCATSALFFSDENRCDEVAKFLRSRYLVFRTDGTTRVSPDWDGVLFV